MAALSSGVSRCAAGLAALLGLCALAAAPAYGLSFGTAPALPALPGVTLNGQAQTISAKMNNFSVSATILDLSAGWNVTVNGDSSSGHSAVFKVYCPGPSACGSDPVGYVSGGATLAANSMTLNSTGASWTGSGSTAPTFLCNSGCNVDSATPVKIANVSSLSVVATWTTTGWSANSVAVSLPTTVRTPGQSGEVYRVDVIWTLNSGP
jgi:hypothetical protein